MRLFPPVTLVTAMLGALALGGCSTFTDLSNKPASVKGFVAWISPYKPDIVQGNVVTTEQIAQIKPGMTRVQVRDILGTPLITDPFHAQRWDYVFTMKRQGFEDQQRTFFVLFDNDAVQKVDSPALPSEDEFVAQISRKPLPTKTPKLALTPEEKAALPLPAPVAQSPAASAAAPTGPTRKYPP
ncbi:MAG TPA: outer membrane protein assembly factor BamE, partial [Burkholderiaceae bacterium]